MKKLFALSLFVIKSVSAGSLTCETYFADKVIGIKTQHNIGTTVASALKQSQLLKFPRKVQASIHHNPALMQALAGNWLYICQDNSYGVLNGCFSTNTQISPNGDTVTPVLGIPSSLQNSARQVWYLVLSTSANSEAQEAHVNEVPIYSPINVNISIDVQDSNGNTLSEPTNGNLIIITNPKITDSVFIPSTIDLGNLSEGYNTSDVPIVTTLNTNNHGIKLTSNTTDGASLTVNNKISQAGEIYRPPFNLGMFVSSGAKPGTYISTVNATWTCP